MRHTGGYCGGGNLYQIKTLFPGLSGRILRRHDAKLLAVRANHAYFTCADALIHLNKAFIYAILLNPPGKLTLLVELRGAPHMWQDIENYSMGGWPDDPPREARRVLGQRCLFES